MAMYQRFTGILGQCSSLLHEVLPHITAEKFAQRCLAVLSKKVKPNVWVVVPLLNEHDKKCFLFQKFLLANKAPTLSKNSITSLRHFPVKAVCSLVRLLSEFYIQF